MLLGFAAYFQLGQDEDPPFTFRAMVVRTYWPGATAQQVAEQVTDKLERALQEAPYADKIRSYSKPGESQIIFQIKDSSKPGDVANVWYTVRKKIGDMRFQLPRRRAGPVLQRRFRRRLRRDLRAGVRRRLQLRRAQDLRRRRAPATAARAGRRQGRTVRRAGRKALRRDLAEAPGAARAGLQPGAAAAGPAERGGIGRRGADAAGRRAGARGRPVRGGGATARHADPRRLAATSCAWATSPRSSAATSTRRSSRCGTRARK